MGTTTTTRTTTTTTTETTTSRSMMATTKRIPHHAAKQARISRHRGLEHAPVSSSKHPPGVWSADQTPWAPQGSAGAIVDAVTSEFQASQHAAAKALQNYQKSVKQDMDTA